MPETKPPESKKRYLCRQGGWRPQGASFLLANDYEPIVVICVNNVTANTPRSDYLFMFFQPILDELLFLGADYESAFDRFELLYALAHGHRYEQKPDSTTDLRFWGAVGRFSWKGARHGFLLDATIAEAEAKGPSWPPVREGLFGGSLDRFKEVASGYREMLRKRGPF